MTERKRNLNRESKYEHFDVDGDGVVTDEELTAMEVVK